MLLHLKAKGSTQKTEYAVTVLMISLTWGPKINPQDNGFTTKEYEHHQAGPHGPQERIVGTQAGRHVQNQPDPCRNSHVCKSMVHLSISYTMRLFRFYTIL